MSFLAILVYSAGQRPRAEAVVHRMVKRAIDMEGTVTVRLSLPWPLINAAVALPFCLLPFAFCPWLDGKPCRSYPSRCWSRVT